MRLLLIISFLLGGFIPMQAQLTVGEDAVPTFRGQSTDQGVFLEWEISGGYTCNGTQIMRSSDGQSWTEAGRIEGLCGSPDVVSRYDFVDPYPEANRTNYYRLEFGGWGVTKPVTVFHLDFGSNDYLLFPDPGNDRLEIVFRNTSLIPANIHLFDLGGRKIREVRTESANSHEFFLPYLPSGLLIFHIVSDEGKLLASGKFSKQTLL